VGYGPAMDEDGYFGGPVAARYDESVADMNRPDVVDPAVGFLAELGLMLWLLVKGVNVPRWKEQASAARKPASVVAAVGLGC